MGDEKEADCYPNPCYSTVTVSRGFNRRAVGVSQKQVGANDKEKHLYDPVHPSVKPLEVHTSTETTSVAKIPRNVNKSVIMVVFICIATASAVIACVALSVSIWSAIKFSANSRSTMETQSNQMFVTQDQLDETIRNLSSSLVNTFNDELEHVTDTLNTDLHQVNDTLSDSLLNLVNDLQSFLPKRQVPECGPGNWLMVAYLNMSDSSQQCPSAWREYSSPAVRSCGRPVSRSSSGSCPSTSFVTCGYTYRRVCGRAFGYQYGTPDAFNTFQRQPQLAHDNYVDGVSVTHGNPRNHIWTFAAGHSTSPDDTLACLCNNPGANESPLFVANGYFCESTATNRSNSVREMFYANNKLWDGTGIGCTSGTCCTFNSPPWFSVQLPSSTSDDIEVRICGDEETDNEDTPIELLEIYVQ